MHFPYFRTKKYNFQTPFSEEDYLVFKIIDFASVLENQHTSRGNLKQSKAFPPSLFVFM